MSGEEERSLLQRWRVQRDDRALARLVRAHLERVERIAGAFAGLEVAREDLVQEGVVGLLTAIARFEVRHGKRLADYANSWVKMQMVRFVVASLAPFRVEARRVAAAISVGCACSSHDDKQARGSLGALVDPAPNAEEWMSTVEEESERERSLRARLASLTAEERAVIGALHFGEPVGVEVAAANVEELEWKAMSKLLLAPGERAADVHVLLGGRRRRLNRDYDTRPHGAAAVGGG